MQTHFIAPGRSGSSTSSNLKAPTAGGLVRKNWIAINQLAAGLLGQAGAVQALRGALESAKNIARRLDTLHPFKLYQLPSVLRETPDPATDWRKFLVRAGRVFETDATGTDAIDSDPDSEEYAASPTEITVPEATDDYYFWIEIDTAVSPTTAIVRHGTLAQAIAGSSGGSPWPDAPVPDSEHIPIGTVDTDTYASDYQPKVRQLLRTDIIQVGSGGSFQRFLVKSVQGDYMTCWAHDGSQLIETDVLVAKAPAIRHSVTSQTVPDGTATFDGHAIAGGVCTRTAHQTGKADQNETVLPIWQLGSGQDSYIWAFRPVGGTGVATAPVWQDSNVDARAWQELFPYSDVLSSSG